DRRPRPATRGRGEGGAAAAGVEPGASAQRAARAGEVAPPARGERRTDGRAVAGGRVGQRVRAGESTPAPLAAPPPPTRISVSRLTFATPDPQAAISPHRPFSPRHRAPLPSARSITQAGARAMPRTTRLYSAILLAALAAGCGRDAAGPNQARLSQETTLEIASALFAELFATGFAVEDGAWPGDGMPAGAPLFNLMPTQEISATGPCELGGSISFEGTITDELD